MNYNQQIQGYNCNGGCLRMFPASGVKRHCLDDNQGMRLFCVLCSECNHYQFSSKAKIGYFPLLTDYLKLFNADGLCTEIKEIKTTDFESHEKAEIRFQQEQLNYRQQQFDKSLFNCDKCCKPIAYGEEKEYPLVRYKPNTSMVSDMKWRILCPPCEKPLFKGLVPNTTFGETGRVKNLGGTPTFIRFQEYKEKLRDQANPMAKIERQVEEERQAKMKKELEKLGF